MKKTKKFCPKGVEPINGNTLLKFRNSISTLLESNRPFKESKETAKEAVRRIKKMEKKYGLKRSQSIYELGAFARLFEELNELCKIIQVRLISNVK